MSRGEITPETLGALAHDVGKYITRVAGNVAPVRAPLPEHLHAMLLVDLYGDRARPRPSARFDALLGAAPADLGVTPSPREVRRWLGALDALEERVRSAEPDAVAQAVELALAVSRAVATWVRDWGAEEPDER